MVRLRHDADQAIQAATVNAAQALGPRTDVGAIAVGRFGDIIAVTGDPLGRRAALENVSFRDEGRQR